MGVIHLMNYKYVILLGTLNASDVILKCSLVVFFLYLISSNDFFLNVIFCNIKFLMHFGLMLHRLPKETSTVGILIQDGAY